MVEDYRILTRRGTAERTGSYEITRQGTRRRVVKFVERYETPVGAFLPEKWKKKALEAIGAEGKMKLLENITEYCRKHCAWLYKEEEIEEHAINCLCSQAYRYWGNFKSTEI